LVFGLKGVAWGCTFFFLPEITPDPILRLPTIQPVSIFQKRENFAILGENMGTDIQTRMNDIQFFDLTEQVNIERSSY